MEAVPLDVINAHERDARIRFDEEAHVYYIDGERYPTSVSGVIHDHFPSFDAESTINTYYKKWARDASNKYCSLIWYLTKILKFDEAGAKGEIAHNWSVAGERASGDGTHTHLQIELSLNGLPHDSTTPDFAQYEAWRATRPGWRPYRTEWSVFDESALLCGQIDSVWVDKDGLHRMVDWKRVGEMTTVAFRGERGFGPMSKFPNTKLSHYELQQNLYTAMVERSYGIRIASMELVQVHPTLDTFKVWELKRIDDAVNAILDDRRARVLSGDLRVVTDAKRAKHERPLVDRGARFISASAAVSVAEPASDEELEAASRKDTPHNPLYNYLSGVLGLSGDALRRELRRGAERR